jgi:uncharacterized glyoxalase superfamily protein PhnB
LVIAWSPIVDCFPAFSERTHDTTSGNPSHVRRQHRRRTRALRRNVQGFPLFGELSAGGSVFIPPSNDGFSAQFAWFADRFGLSWQLNLS